MIQEPPRTPPESRAPKCLARGPWWAVLASLAVLSAAPPARAQEQLPGPGGAGGPDPARQLVHVLGYLSRDYAMAVREGQVINEAEYAEQREFAAEAARLAGQVEPVAGDGKVMAGLDGLAALIDAKGPRSEVEALAVSLAQAVVGRVGLATSPRRWPDLSRGGRLFEGRCAACHGAKGRGDGEKAAGLDPAPVNLHDPEWMGPLSPFAVFGAIALGVDGTAMAANPDLSEPETWDLAFYAVSLRHQGAAAALPRDLPSELASLEARATLSDAQLLGRAQAAGLEGPSLLSALRTDLTPPSSAQALAAAHRHLDSAAALAAKGRFEEAGRAALAAYLEGIEPIEAALGARSAGQVARIEAKMAALRASMRLKESAAIALALEEARAVLEDAEKTLGSGDLSAAVAFTGAAVILLREGLEAVLILVVLLGLLKAWEAPHLARLVHWGWVAALGAGLLTWALSGRLFTLSGAGRETLEGVTGLVAVVVLLYVGFWLHRATVGEQWKRMLDSKARAALEQGRGAGLFLLAFLAVYREAFETVLFYRALWLEAGTSGHGALLGGFGAGAAALAGLCVALFWFEARLPLKQVFGFSSLVMALLAFVLTGKAVHSFQESGALETDLVSWMGRLDLLGVYPTRQSLLAQAVVLALAVFLWWWASRGAGAAGGGDEEAAAS